MRTRVIVWFRNDLRLLDNAVVARAATLYGQSSATTEVLPVYVFDETYFKASKRGMSRFGAGRAKFTLECVADLKKSLNVIGSDLLVRCGKTEDVFTELLLTGENTKTVILTQTEVTSEETDMDQMIEKLAKDKAGRDGGSVSMERLWGSTLYHIDDLPFNANDGLNDLPDVFTPFRNKVESKCAVRSIIPAPQANALGAVPAVDQMEKMPTPSDLPFSSQDLAASCDDLIKRGHDERAVLNFIGGESHALARVKYYIWDSDLLATYFETRNGMLGGDYSTKLAPWLALGCVSPRFVVSEIRRYESERVENKSTYWVIFELIWRDFFKFFALKHGNSIFHLDGTAGRRASWKQDSKILEAWKTGSTGYPLIDANMRELAATGFMSNRGRQNVASWLALDAGIDWRHGADWFEHHLLDYDTASNWGNWCAAAGMTGGRINRFNIAKQTKDYDPQGEYIKTWCPELAQVPAAYIADPNQAPRDLRDRLNLDYPNKIQLPYRDYTAMGSPPGGIGGRGGRGARGARGGRGGRSSKHKQNARGAHASSVYDAVYG
jgi:deoxyribodipyrimidine photo-lyase